MWISALLRRAPLVATQITNKTLHLRRLLRVRRPTKSTVRIPFLFSVSSCVQRSPNEQQAANITPTPRAMGITTTTTTVETTATSRHLSASIPPSYRKVSSKTARRRLPLAKLPLRPRRTTLSTFAPTVSNLPLTNGLQVKGGSCNGAPMGVIAAQDKIPTAKFVFPTNFATVKANTNFTVKLSVRSSRLATS